MHGGRTAAAPWSVARNALGVSRMSSANRAENDLSEVHPAALQGRRGSPAPSRTEVGRLTRTGLALIYDSV